MLSKSNYQSVGIHILVWIAYGLLSFNWFLNFTTFDRALLLSIRSVSIHAIIFYVNIKVLLPYLVDKNRYWLYLLSVIALIVVAYFLSEWTKGLMDHLVEAESNRPRRVRTRKSFISPRILVQSASLIAVLFISTTYWMTLQSRKRKQKEALLQNENLSSELRFLKSQINPHFLFNALNNIYSLSYTKSKKTPDMIMKLSEMMRYVLYESNEKKVSVAKEIAYIVNFIEFQKLKIEGEPKITFETEGTNLSVMLEPMLFIPFIENSFKHSNIENISEGWIKIKLRSVDRSVSFEIANSVPAEKLHKDDTPGIGLENVKKRLALLYPDRHDLKIEQDDKTFRVSLTILI